MTAPVRSLASRTLRRLPAGQRLSHHRALEVESQVREEEVRRQRLPHVSILVAFENDRMRLVPPRDPVPVENASERALDRVRELVCHTERFPLRTKLQTADTSSSQP